MIAIIGAGASGLIAAIECAKKGAKVCVYEKNNKIGKKILATGNGRCNITNENIELKKFHSNSLEFAKPVLNQFSTSTCKKYFASLGLEMVVGNKGRLYPASLQASSVVALLEYEARRLGVEFFCESEVSKVTKNKEGFFLHVNDKKIEAKKVLVATGSFAMPTLGSSESGYEIAQSFGHTLISAFASLTQLITQENLKALSGVKIEAGVSVYSGKNLLQQEFGDVLFTDYGLSGSCILDVSRMVAKNLLEKNEVNLKLDLLPDMSKEKLKTFLLQRQKNAYDKSIALWLDGFINSKIARFFAREFVSKLARELSPKEIMKLCFSLKEFCLHVKDTKGFKNAEVSAGGVNVDEINPQSLESKLQKGLFFSGEVLDVDGDCGGYNLHWAWASGFCVGKSMVQ